MRYRAFLSYSHRDAKSAHRIHAALESWRIDKDLAGRSTTIGPVPRMLRPVFRDREDLSGGGTLSSVIKQALSESMFLVDLCSPHAAASKYVNDEVRHFKAMGRAERIIPLIVDGEPGHSEQECFPPALTHAVGTDGSVLDEREDLVAADAREQTDGYSRALAKVAAGLLGLPFDEVVRYAERTQRRRTRLLAGVAAGFLVLAVAAGGLAWLSETRRVLAERNFLAALSASDSLLGDVGEELIRVEGVSLDTTRRVIDRARSILDDLATSLPERTEIKASKVASLLVFAKALDAKGDASAALAQFREAESLVATLAPKWRDGPAGRQLQAMVQWRLGVAEITAGNTDEGTRRLGSAVDALAAAAGTADQSSEMRLELHGASNLLALRLIHMDRLDEAEHQLHNADALSADWPPDKTAGLRQRVDRLTIEVTRAELQRRRGDARGSLERLAAVERELIEEATALPDVPQLRKLLATVRSNLAVQYGKFGDKAEAQALGQRSIDTLELLAQRDAEALDVQRLLAEDLARKGDALAAEGKLEEAVDAFARSRESLERLWSGAPEDDQVRSSLELSLAMAANTLRQHGYRAGAESAVRRLVDLRESALQAAPGDAGAKRSLMLALWQQAELAEMAGEMQDALALRERQLRLLEELAAEDGEVKRRELSEAHHEIGLLLWRLSRRAEAIPHYARRIALIEELVAETPLDRSLHIELGHGLLNLGELRTLTGDRTRARKAFEQCLALRQRLLEQGPREAPRVVELAWAEARLAQFGDTPARRWRRVEKLLTEADLSEPLTDIDEELLTSARIVTSVAQ